MSGASSIVVVEDEQEVRAILEEQLAALGYGVRYEARAAKMLGE